MKYADSACRSQHRPSAGLSIVVLLIMLLMPILVASQELAMESPYKVKAAFLRNFAFYVNWPEHLFPESHSPWRIGILGPDPFGEVLESTLEGRTVQNRRFEIFHAPNLNELPACQIIFISYPDAAKRRATLDQLKDKPVLTVGDAPAFLQEGGIIGFQVTDRVRMNINLDQARAVSLSIQTKMLEVSTEILENGLIRRMR
jgi:hypothetical protein